MPPTAAMQRSERGNESVALEVDQVSLGMSYNSVVATGSPVTTDSPNLQSATDQ